MGELNEDFFDVVRRFIDESILTLDDLINIYKNNSSSDSVLALQTPLDEVVIKYFTAELIGLEIKLEEFVSQVLEILSSKAKKLNMEAENFEDDTFLNSVVEFRRCLNIVRIESENAGLDVSEESFILIRIQDILEALGIRQRHNLANGAFGDAFYPTANELEC